MPFRTQCPGCRRALTVPDALRGKMVRCPKCQVTFAAEDAPEADDGPVVVARHRTTIRAPRYEEPEYDEPEPRYEDEDDDYEDRPRRRKRSRRTRARDAVAGPAIALMAMGLFSVFVSLGLSGYALTNVMTAEIEAPPPQPGMTLQEVHQSRRAFDVGARIGMGGCIGVPALMALPGALIALGANQMRTLGSYGFAMTAAFLAVLPCQPCCVLGLPFGIWALVTLNDEEVKDAFG
jgi:hypothetical protein